MSLGKAFFCCGSDPAKMIQPIEIKTQSRTELVDVTARIERILESENARTGTCLIYAPHTTAAVTINEGADPSVKEDILLVLNKIVPWKEAYRHLEGNSPAHVKASLIGPSETVAFENGHLVLGTWQKVFFCEFDGPRRRKLHLHILPHS